MTSIYKNKEIDFINIEVKEDTAYNWGDIIKLEKKVSDEVPAGKLPAWLEDFTYQVSRAVQSPLDMSYALAIGVLSIALTRKFNVKLSNTQIVTLNTYTTIIADSGERKSATFSPFLKPVEDYEIHLQKESSEKIARRESFRKSLEIKKNTVENEIKKEYSKSEKPNQNKIDDLTKELSEINYELSEHPPIVQPMITIGDVTPEKFSKILSQQNETISIASAESTFFSDFGGAYNSNGSPRQESILGAYSGDTSKVSRVNEQSDGITLRNPLANVLIMIQPAVLENVNEALKGRGLLNRFLFYKPKSMVGHRDIEDYDIDEAIRKKYSDYIMTMLNIPAKDYSLTLSDKAKTFYKEFKKNSEHDLQEGQSLHEIQGWGNRLPTTVIKLAGLLHVAENVENHTDIPKQIQAETLIKAIDLSDYFVHQTKNVTELLNVDEVDRIADKFISNITTGKKFKGLAHINARELKGSVYGRDNERTKDEAINKLCDHNYIRKYKEGRKKMIEVNPVLLGGD